MARAVWFALLALAPGAVLPGAASGPSDRTMDMRTLEILRYDSPTDSWVPTGIASPGACYVTREERSTWVAGACADADAGWCSDECSTLRPGYDAKALVNVVGAASWGGALDVTWPDGHVESMPACGDTFWWACLSASAPPALTQVALWSAHPCEAMPALGAWSLRLAVWASAQDGGRIRSEDAVDFTC